MSIYVEPRYVFKFLLQAIALLLLANLTVIISKYQFGYDSLLGLVPLFFFDLEKNVPTLFSCALLLSASLILLLISRNQKMHGTHHILWLLLSVIFAFLSVDEIASIHNKLIIPVRGALDTSGAFHFAWVIPYGIALLVLAGMYIKFLKDLPQRTAILFIVSGGMYVGGALGFEMISGFYRDTYGEFNLTYALIASGEELLEMSGIALFIYTLLDFMARPEGGVLHFRVEVPEH